MPADDRTHREQLLRDAVLRGDERAWRLWYDASYAELRAYVVWRCGGRRDLAEEVVQEVWLVAVRGIRQFDPLQGTFAAWLRGIALNVLNNHRRKQGTRGMPVSLEVTDPAAPAPRQDRIDQMEEADRIAAALGALPEKYEAVLRAKYLEQMSVGEIASAWNESLKAIESLLTRARDAFRERYSIPAERPSAHVNSPESIRNLP
jgi:RNA polymerase sigma-70 factor (ECF subfamily)